MTNGHDFVSFYFVDVIQFQTLKQIQWLLSSLPKQRRLKILTVSPDIKCIKTKVRSLVDQSAFLSVVEVDVDCLLSRIVFSCSPIIWEVVNPQFYPTVAGFQMVYLSVASNEMINLSNPFFLHERRVFYMIHSVFTCSLYYALIWFISLTCQWKKSVFLSFHACCKARDDRLPRPIVLPSGFWS